MNRRLLLLFLTLLFPIFTAKAESISTLLPDFSSFKTADELWSEMGRLQEQPQERPLSRDDAVRQVALWIATQQKAAEAFVKSFPGDPRSWEARLLAIRAEKRLRGMLGLASDTAIDRQRLDEVINAPDALAPIKGEAAAMRVMTWQAEIDPRQPDTFVPFYKAAADFLDKYPDHPLAGEMKTLEMQMVGQDPSPRGTEMLQQFAKGPDPRLAAAAMEVLARRAKIAELKSKPVDLKFTAVDGQPVDLANLRGKVVLLDFWSSLCGPCIAEMPNLVQLYSKWHDKGFEIVGVTMDEEKDAMEQALKEQNMTWPQHFDGAGFKGKIPTEFNIVQLPTMFLLDKKGMIRQVDLRGPDLGTAVEQLLTE